MKIKSISDREFGFWLCGVCVGFALTFIVNAVYTPKPPPRLASYNDQITLPVEAFGAHWRIKNFRKNVPFPDGFDDAIARALAAARLFDRHVVISLAPRLYTLRRPIDLGTANNLTFRGHSADKPTRLRMIAPNAYDRIWL